MRYLILSDIHANWEALYAVLQEANDKYDEIVSCGDFVGYGADPNLVVDWARDSVKTVLRGNHDKACVGLSDLEWFNTAAQLSAIWTNRELSPENLEYLRSLPQGPLEKNGFEIVHGSPCDEDEYLVTTGEVARAACHLRVPLTFFGHTHLQGAYQCHRNAVREMPRPQGNDTERTFELEPDSAYLINPGSVGQPRDGDPRAAYAIYDAEPRTISLHRVGYSISRTQAKIRKAGLPMSLADRLSFGR